jgi:hypothetical protein
MCGKGLASSAGPSRSPVVGVAWSDKVIRLLNITFRPWITGTGACAIRRMAVRSTSYSRTAGTGQHSERRSDGPMDQDDDVIGDDERIKAREVAKAGDGNVQVKEGFLWSGSLAA